MSYPIPRDALDDRLAIVGTAGSGKTYAALGACEHLLARHSRLIFVDPLGVAWGLRLCEDGKTASPFQPVIFGGAHGDLPINEHAGALIGETVATMRESCIIDLSQLGTKAVERRFMLAFLTALYRCTNKEPVHLIIDEADMFAPQNVRDKDGEAFKLLGMMETVVRRGRVRGFIPWLISQRPAVINKDVLSQADGLVAMKLTSFQDREHLGDWVEGQADKGEWKTMHAELATLQRGQGLLWIPGRAILSRVEFPPKATYDSSRTPKRGEKRRAAELKPIDLGALKERLATVETEAKASDPRALKAEIARLKAEAAKGQKTIPVVPDRAYERTVEGARKEGFGEGYLQGWTDGHKAGFVVGVSLTNREMQKRLGGFVDVEYVAGIPPKVPQGTIRYQPVMPAPAARASTNSAPRAPRSNGQDEGRPLGAERRPLAALASVYPAGMTEAQWAVAAGLKRSGGTWGTYVSRLRTAGCIEHRDGLYFASEQGIADLGGDIPSMPPPGPALIDFWVSKISGIGPMLRVLASVYPNRMSREQLAQELNMAASGGTFGTYISRLRSPGLIDVDRDGISASSSLMEST